ncbi:DUF2027 domain-containing protein [Prevotella sp.]|uniref:DUF2027 domain-containing protein n=1 Tax=Prevotella sp. TaxID=59823 RepID=UPI0026479EB7|nr:DUF2027 domain-containing protein [Prevotella sp.]MDN5552996.1 DUF2027 domain-containing protein [Prevotella sp.]
MKIGDKVRFLSETGGGKVAGFQGNNIVLVEDEDGFQIPFPINEVVLIGEDNYATSKLVSSKMAAESKQNGIEPDGRSIKTLLKDGQDDVDVSLNEEDKYDTVDDEKEVTFRAPVEERKGGNMLSAYIAFVPMDINNVTSTRFETYFVNDSNYYIQFCYMIAEGNSWNLKYKGEVEPNTKLYIEEFGRDALNDMNHIAVQFISYKLEKGFILKPSVDAQFRIDPVKFYKLHTFQDTQFFESPALLYSLIVDDVPARPLVVDPKVLKKEMFASADNEKKESQEHVGSYIRRYEDGKNGNAFKIKHRGDDDIVVIDLHADELLDTTAGMNTADILNYQMKKFRDILAEYANKKGQKIVFIHGKGEGVLRSSIINELHYRYKKYAYQDASFQEYGYGATQVTIR